MSSTGYASIINAVVACAAAAVLLSVCRFISGDIRWTVGVLIVVGLFSGCTFYNHAWKVDKSSPEQPYDLRVVQVDDFGSFWDPAQAEAVAAEIDKRSLDENLMIVVFIHGWHNNAQPDNANLINFKESLGRITKLIGQREFADVRQKLTGHRDVRLVGVYIGWRGKSLPMPLDYATMWWRKEAAERVGDGDVSEFLERLQRTYLRANSTIASDKNAIIKPFTGLVTFGHSFGGQVLLKALARPLENDLVRRTQGAMADTSNPPELPAPSSPLEYDPIDSYGDLNVLLNPALEAYQYARIDSLYRKLHYPNSQTPQLLVLSADDDWARKSFFPIARLLTLPFRASFKNDYQTKLFSKALGELQEQQTHDLNPVKDTQDSLSSSDYLDEVKIRNFDFSGTITFSHVQLKPRISPGVSNTPVAVAVTHNDIIREHSGIFGAQLRDFLINYIAFLEGKRMLIRREKLEKSFRDRRSQQD